MFDVGTRVIVLESSFKGKTGPKRGSVGHVCKLDIPGINLSTFDTQRFWFVEIYQIFFTRYGFEEKKRNESKFFINIFPYDFPYDLLSEEIDQKIKDIQEFNPSGCEVYDHLRYAVTSKFGVDHVHHGIVVPSHCKIGDITLWDNYDFLAWLECFLKNRHFMGGVNALVNNFNRVEKVFNPDSLISLKKMRDSNAEKMTTLAAAEGNPDIRKDIVETVRKVLLVARRPKEKRAMEKDWKWIKGNLCGDFSTEVSSVQLAMKHMYTRRLVDYLKVMTKTYGDKDFLKRLKSMLDTSNRMVSLARELEERGEEIEASNENK